MRCFTVKENQVFYVAIARSLKILGIAFYSRYVVAKIIHAEHFVHHNFDVMADLIVDMQVNRTARR